MASPAKKYVTHEEFDAFKAQMVTRADFDPVKNGLETLSGRVDTLTGRVDELTARVDTLSQRW